MSNLLLTTIICSLIIIVVILISPLLKGYSRKWRYFVFIIIAIRMLIPVPIITFNNALTIPVFLENTAEENQNNFEDIYIKKNTTKGNVLKDFTKTNILSDANKGMEHTDITDNATNRLMLNDRNKSLDNNNFIDKICNIYVNNKSKVLFVVWITGCIAFLLYNYCMYTCYVRSLKKNSQQIVEKRYIDILNEEKNILKIKGNVFLYKLKKINTPIIMGVKNTTVILPDISFLNDELKFIFRHELVHKHRKDLYVRFLYFLVKTIYWFNPISYLFAQKAYDDMEILCDDMVVKNMERKQRIVYNETLLRIASFHEYRTEQREYMSLSFVRKTNVLKHRMLNIMDFSHKKSGYPVIVLTLIIIFLSNSIVYCKEFTEKNQTSHHREELETSITSQISKYNSGTDAARNDIAYAKTILDDGQYDWTDGMTFDFVGDNSYFENCIFSVAAYEEYKYGYLNIDEERYYWKCIELAVKACHNSGFLIGINTSSKPLLNYCPKDYDTVRYEVNKEVVYEFGKAFLGKILSPYTIPEESNIEYDDKKETYFFSFDNKQEYVYINSGYSECNEGSFHTYGKLSSIEYDSKSNKQGYIGKESNYIITLKKDLNSKLVRANISNIKIE